MRHNYIITFSIAAISLFIYSCGVMRSLGLYNVPPSYSETYEEYFHKKCIDHSNSRENLSIYIKPIKEVFSPFEDVEIEAIITNSSPKDTMYIFHVGIKGLSVYDSTNRHIPTYVDKGCVLRVFVADKFGRYLTSTVLGDCVPIAPQNSLIKSISFNTGLHLPDTIKKTDAFIPRVGPRIEKENFPGKYTAFYRQKHQELDQIKGFFNVDDLVSDTVEFYVRDYTPEEKQMRGEVADIFYGAHNGNSRQTTDSLIALFSHKYPDNFYVQQLKYDSNMFYIIDSLNKAKSKK
jgi:hypothetical protein